ncbi:unnamed protein product [Cuscuta campestris]|uniref:Uncharacterized protein n=1 Tax=Cuscuta campestris TaxID=132261 RepID=A0A484LGA8_9ASTE|nr:unnamed protein product [Cuscuta campestris]
MAGKFRTEIGRDFSISFYIYSRFVFLSPASTSVRALRSLPSLPRRRHLRISCGWLRVISQWQYGFLWLMEMAMDEKGCGQCGFTSPSPTMDDGEPQVKKKQALSGVTATSYSLEMIRTMSTLRSTYIMPMYLTNFLIFRVHRLGVNGGFG